MSLRIKLGAGEAREVEDLKITTSEGVTLTGTAGQGTDDLDLAISLPNIEIAEDYADAGSHQTIAADLTLDAAAGTSDAGDTDFLGAIMGNVLGAALTKTKNYIGGLIGMYSITGSNASVLPKAGVLGIIADGTTTADGIVVGHLDGSDPSTQTRANAVFKATMANAHASSGVDYGVDLHAPAIDIGSETEVVMPIAKASLRLDREVCVILVDGVPVDYTDGDPAGTGEGYAAKGSLAVDYTNGKLYINTGTKTQPAWTVVGSQS